MNRRRFVKLGTIVASATALLPGVSRAAEDPAYTLEPLPYGFDALEPHIDAKTMEIHHGKHHAAYVKNLNTALATSPELAKLPLEKLLTGLAAVPDEGLRNTLRNNGGGHWNHDFFWKTLTSPGKSGKPSADFTAAITAAFGTMEAFQKSFGEAAGKRFGSGWAWLIVKDGKLKITSTANQDNPSMAGLVPETDLGSALLGLDVWEHAYYLHYQNRRPDYVTAWWNIVNWEVVSERFAAVK